MTDNKYRAKLLENKPDINLSGRNTNLINGYVFSFYCRHFTKTPNLGIHWSMKKQCKAIAATTNVQCKKNALPGSNYCFYHYPKESVVIGAFLSAIIGLLLGAFFSNAISGHLSKYRLFYYLDKETPTITKTSPELNTNSNVLLEMDTLTIFADDEGSGIDFEKSTMDIFRKDNQSLTKVNSNVDKTISTFRIKPSKGLRTGEYIIELRLVDKAGNVISKSYPLVLKDRENLNVNIQSKAYTSSKKDQFSAFVEKHGDLIKMYQLCVFDVYIHNPTESAFLRDVYISLDTSVTIFSFIEAGSLDVKDFESYSLAESMNRMLPKEKVFLSQRFLKIGEMAPGGLVHISILGGIFTKFQHSLPQFFGVFGTYVYDGYGIRDICKIQSRVPIKYQ